MTTIALGAACLLLAPALGGTEPTKVQAEVADPNAPSVPVSDPQAPVFAITAPETTTVGEPASIDATVDVVDATGEIVVLDVLDGDTWTPAASAEVASDDTVTLSVTPAEAESFSYRLRLAATTRHHAGTSEVFAVRAVAADAAVAPLPEASKPAKDLCGGDQPKRPDGSRWVCTYDDEFDGSQLDRRYWVPQRSSSTKLATGTAQQPSCFTDSPDTIWVGDGRLSLGAKVLDSPVSCGSSSTTLVSGMVSHLGTFSQTYGRFEVRAKVPSWSGKGLQETFWLWPVDQLKYGLQHPASGEIDFGEFYSNYAYLNVPVIHYLFDPYTISYATNTNIYTAHKCFINVGAFNTYTLVWEPGRLTIDVNGTNCLIDNYVATNAPADHPNAPFDSPFYLALTQAFGASGNEFDPAVAPHSSSTEVDYVRVWG